MDIKLCSYNCKGLNVSKIPAIKHILQHCDVLLLQETCLMSHQSNHISRYLGDDYTSFDVSGMNHIVFHNGRPFGGCSVVSLH